METPLKAISIKIPRELLETIDRIAEKTGAKRSAVIREMVIRYIEMLEKNTIIVPRKRAETPKEIIMISSRSTKSF
jgi:metal-responsive CopG/Arc/MetJ family transcriptional regulator